jgi:hypothetical protein
VRRLLTLFAVVTLLGGCGVVTTTERSFDAGFIRQVGDGSTALAEAVHSFEAARFPAGLRDPKLQAPIESLLAGKLNQLTQGDLVEIAEANQKIAHKYEGALASLESARRRLRGGLVKAGSYNGLSDGARRFVTVWNKALLGLATAAALDGAALEREAPLVNELQTVLRAAYHSKDRATAERFNRVRLKYLHDVVGAGHRLEATRAAIRKDVDEGELNDVVQHDSDARAIVTKVNERYPSGGLAKQFK